MAFGRNIYNYIQNMYLPILEVTLCKSDPLTLYKSDGSCDNFFSQKMHTCIIWYAKCKVHKK